MANLTTTVSESLTLVGLAPPSLWGTMVWGTGKWGEDPTQIPLAVGSSYLETLSPSDAAIFAVETVYAEAEAPTDDVIREFAFSYGETLATMEDETSEIIMLGGFSYLFVLPTENAEDRSTIAFTKASPGSTAWTSLTVNTTPWS